MATIKGSALPVIASVDWTESDAFILIDIDAGTPKTYRTATSSVRDKMSTPATDATGTLGSSTKRWAEVDAVFGAFGTTPATAGPVRIPNNAAVTSRNAANTANVDVIKLDSSNNVVIGAATIAPSISLTAGGTTSLKVGAYNSGSYNAVSFNGDLSTTILGIYGRGSGDNSLYYDVPTGGSHKWRINNVDIGTIVGGILAWGTTTVAAASGGEIILPDQRYLRGVDGITTRPLIGFDSTKGVVIPLATNALLIGATTATGASAGDCVISFGKTLRSVNAAGTSTMPLIGAITGDKTSLSLNAALLRVNDAVFKTTVGAAGGASALPATPVKYWRIEFDATEYIIPLYNP